MSIFGAMSKMKSYKFDRIVLKVHGICFVFCFCERIYTHIPTAHALYRHIGRPKSSETKHHAEFQFWNIYVFYIAPYLITLRTFTHIIHDK